MSLKQVWVVSCLAMGLGCGGAADEVSGEVEAVAPQLGTSKAELYLASSTIWPKRTFSVCWENPTYGDPTDDMGRYWTRQAVEGQWARVANLAFTGWGACTSAYSDVRIRIADANPITNWLGKGLGGVYNGMTLNLTYDVWANTVCGLKNSSGYYVNRETCTKAHAVHEFGHMLGFAHEQDRSERSTVEPTCTESSPWFTPTGDSKVTAYDTLSIMNYCYGDHWKHFGELSVLDVEGVRQVYGGRPGTLVGGAGNCLDTEYGSTADWTLTKLNRCDPSQPTQAWTRQSNNSIKLNAANRCLDVRNGSTSSGSQIQIYTCSSGAGGQTWIFDKAVISGNNGKCLGTVSNATTSGTTVVMADCNPSAVGQQWTLTTNGEIKNVNGLCLDVRSGNTADNTALQLWGCNSSASQLWSLQTGGAIRGLASKCIDVYGAGTTAGSSAVLYTCSGTTSQRWHLRGALKNPVSGLCLDSIGGASAPGTNQQLYACNGTAAQTWSYFF
ncbi:ricin-type beta-trefoil lectin domain protein [Corallococcus exiguus]|uniref:ricin-type beta-trefoil lectin domain protein n=1 Tax=Corallococcus exiguus TaxID=83462 RepID=UPI001470A5EF|nr:ricin-type beta-trefoil lectin domain protein [Corallococcus exiguus]NNB85569.1 hypothetical protein [Corallococcus exiguus]